MSDNVSLNSRHPEAGCSRRSAAPGAAMHAFPAADPVTALIRLRAEVLRMALDVEALAERRGIAHVRHQVPRLADRFRQIAARHDYVEASRR